MADAMEALLHECPNGVSFDPMALRLLRQKIPFEDGQIEELKDEMFQLGDGLWFSLDMISSDETRVALWEQSEKWLMEYDCFSVERLFESYRGVLHHISTPEHFATFLQHLGFSVVEFGKGGFYCFNSTSSLRECLTSISKTITERLEDKDGMLTLNEIEEILPHLTVDALEDIRTKYLLEIHVAEIGEVPCWRSAEAVHLPDDFSEKLTDAVDILVELGEKVNTGNLEFALNLFYRIRFREEYGLTKKPVFMSSCARHYKGTPKNKQDYSRDFIREWAKHQQGGAEVLSEMPSQADPSSITNGSPSVENTSLHQPAQEQAVNCWDEVEFSVLSPESEQEGGADV